MSKEDMPLNDLQRFQIIDFFKRVNLRILENKIILNRLKQPDNRIFKHVFGDYYNLIKHRAMFPITSHKRVDFDSIIKKESIQSINNVAKYEWLSNQIREDSENVRNNYDFKGRLPCKFDVNTFKHPSQFPLLLTHLIFKDMQKEKSPIELITGLIPNYKHDFFIEKPKSVNMTTDLYDNVSRDRILEINTPKNTFIDSIIRTIPSFPQYLDSKKNEKVKYLFREKLIEERLNSNSETEWLKQPLTSSIITSFIEKLSDTGYVGEGYRHSLLSLSSRLFPIQVGMVICNNIKNESKTFSGMEFDKKKLESDIIDELNTRDFTTIKSKIQRRDYLTAMFCSLESRDNLIQNKEGKLSGINNTYDDTLKKINNKEAITFIDKMVDHLIEVKRKTDHETIKIKDIRNSIKNIK